MRLSLMLFGLVLGAPAAISPVNAFAVAAQSPAAIANNDPAAAVDAFVTQQMKADNLPSVAVGVWVRGQPRLLKAYGVADRTSGLDRNVEQPYRIASITKTFTATVVLQLIDEGRLQLSDPLAKWYPNFPRAGSITINDLLRMRSGIPDSLDDAFLAGWFANPLEPVSAEAVIIMSANRVNEFKPPDTETVYANINYIFLQEIVRKITGRPLGHEIERRILRPLRMTNSSYPHTPGLPGRLRGYSVVGNAFRDMTAVNPNVPGGAGAMISTLGDLNRYAKPLCAGGLLKHATQRERLKGTQMAGEPDFVRYGQGLVFLGDWCGHNGTIFGFSSEMFYLPAADATIVVNVNRLDLDDKSKSANIFLGVSKLLFPNSVRW